MDIYKDFFLHIRRLALEDPCIIVHDTVRPKLKEFILLLINIKFEDGKYHVYFGEIKGTVESFMIYFKITMDEVIKEADRCSNVLEKDELMHLMDTTIFIHQTNHILFGKEYLPVKSRQEKEAYEEIEQKYNAYMEKLYELKAEITKFDKQFKIDDFAKDHFKKTVNKTYRFFTFTQTYISLMLADNVDRIRISLEEILLRMSNNLRQEMTAVSEYQDKLLHDLYDKNKEHLAISRQYRKCSIEFAEVSRSIQLLREKIETCESTEHLVPLKEEVDYWKNLMQQFRQISDVIVQIKTEQENCLKEEGIYNNLTSTELPGSKMDAWKYIGTNYKCRVVYLREKMIEAAKSLLTFFTCKGSDRICYMDNIGRYYLDEFNHQVYPFDYALRYYHQTCDGQLRECPETDPYYLDESGRYIYKDGEKVYQCAPCTSQYKLGQDCLLTKITTDCGHSDRTVETCHLNIKDPTIVEMLPTSDVVDIRNRVDPEVVKYLWDNFGGLLPDALHDVGMAKPMNPIHVLAHKLLWHKYGRTIDEVKQKTKEALEYKANIFKKRQERATEESRAWKCQQVKRRLPEESDDAQDVAVYAAQQAQLDYINSLNYYN